jgi:HEAT repeat protein
MLDLACLLALTAAAQKPTLVLPPPEHAAPARAATEETGARRRAFVLQTLRLRRSVGLGPEAETLVLEDVAARYPDAAVLALELARSANEDEVHGLIKVLRRCGSAEHADELNYLLLTRPLGSATAPAVELLAALRPATAVDTLVSCLSARFAGVRRAAAAELKKRVDVRVLPRLLQLSRANDADVQARALEVLGVLPEAEARSRLIEALGAREANVAAAACEALIAQGPSLCADLQAVVVLGPSGQAFGYAAVALTRLELADGGELLTEAMADKLKAELHAGTPFLRAAAAVALAQLAHRSSTSDPAAYGDREVIDGLMLVVAPGAFVPSYSLLSPPAMELFLRLTGVDPHKRASSLRAWWEQSRPTFVGMRRRVEVSPDNGARATLTLADGGVTWVFVGDGATDAPAPEGASRFLLSGAEMADLVRRLSDLGFMRARSQPAGGSGAEESALPTERVLDLAVDGVRASASAPRSPSPPMDAFVLELAQVAMRERWQLYRDEATEPDPIAFWRAEREWLMVHPDRTERDRRLLDRMFRALARADAARLQTIVLHLQDVPDVARLLTTSHGEAVLEACRRSERLEPSHVALLELAVQVPGDAAWRRVLEVVDERYDAGGKEALPRLFARLGPDRIVASITEGRERVRCAGMHEAASLRDVRAVPALMAALTEESALVRGTATWALGMLRAKEARARLLATADGLEPDLRRITWVALGRIGGEGVFDALTRAMTFPEAEDKRAALQALGKLQDQAAADLLAQIYVMGGASGTGSLAMIALQEHGGLRARPALRRQLTVLRDPRLVREVSLVLAEFQDPTAVPYLLDMLAEEQMAGRAAFLLSAITGVDLTGVNDRAAFMRQWYAVNKDRAQAAWFLDGLRRQNVATTLTVEQLQPHAGVAAVPELTRILTATDLPHLRVLTAALLRDTTQRDFGAVGPSTQPAEVAALADRYRYWAETDGGATRR